MAARVDGLVPVVKGNGYGFGRAWLAERAALLASSMAVGTVFEVDDVPSNYTAFVLTPTLAPPVDLRANAILTVGSIAHAQAAVPVSGTRSVIVKVRSSMQRYGVPAEGVSDLVSQCHRLGLDVAGVSIHPPLHGTTAENLQEIQSSIRHIHPVLPVFVSHLDEATYATLRASHPDRTWNLRLGTSLWHADKTDLTLSADVLDVHTVMTDGVAGYHGAPVHAGSQLVIIGCGSTHGVIPLQDGRSPFHFARHRMALLEPPHMHTSMCVVPPDQPCPAVGDTVDVQRPLTTTAVDIVHWM